MTFRKVAVVGVGLLGGSLGLALRSRRLAGEVWGVVRQARVIPEAVAAGVVDHATTDLSEAVREADLVVLCVPVGAMGSMAEALRHSLMPGALVTDVGSVKASVVQSVEPVVGAAGGWFVGSHPMAGSEKTGFVASRADLFSRAVCVVTPTPTAHRPAVEQIESLWRGVGGTVVTLSPDQHDALVSRASHLPHVLAAGLANCVLGPAGAPEGNPLCATGFRDTTRLASGSPDLWRDIALANRVYLEESLGAFIAEVEGFRKALKGGDVRLIGEFFETAKQRRDAWMTGFPSPNGD